MDFKILASPAKDLRNAEADALLLVVGEGTDCAALGKALGGCLSQALNDGDLAYKAGRCLYLHDIAGVKSRRVVFSVAKDASAKAFRAAVQAGLALIKGGGAKHLLVASALPQALDAAQAQALVAAVDEGLYLYRHTKPSAAPASRLQRVSLACDKADASAVRAALRRGQAIAAGVALARECANRPGNHCTPEHLADEARRLAKAHQLQVQVLQRKDVDKLGMGCFLAVAQGSARPLRFIVLHYQGAAKSAAPLVLVGKGITFDTGGISLKPAAEMDEMKFDMGGAASVLGTLRAVAELKPKINVIGLIPACENMPGAQAVKPGDVVTSMSGQTVEILNTDAEGRLILCDALTYAERFKPAAVIDVATLTGACVVALGHHRSGLFSSDDALAAELDQAGQAALDPCWRMPLDDEYDEALKSNFADMGNVGPRAGGAITAAMFLKRFTAKYPWAHLDIAGSAWKSGANKGATGRPVALLTQFVLSRAR
jgi:leucyl aminopeptidase